MANIWEPVPPRPQCRTAAGLNTIKPVYDPEQPDGWLTLTASAFDQLDQYTSSPGRRAYCYTELAVFFPSGDQNIASIAPTQGGMARLS